MHTKLNLITINIQGNVFLGAGKKSHLTRFARFAANYTHMWYLLGNQNAGRWYSSQCYIPTDWKVVNIL